MAYEHKPGQFSLFPNDYKTKDSHPDFKGTGAALDGTPMEIAAWRKNGSKGEFYSLQIKPKAERAEAAQSRFNRHEDEPEADGGRGIRDLDDDAIPFAPEFR